MTAAVVDPVALAQALIRCPSVTPADAGALAVLQHQLNTLGFTCHRLTFTDPDSEPVDNLYARWGDTAPHFCFAGHTDVVPVGDKAAWSKEPFCGEVDGGFLWGRGAADMKGAVASFVAAVARYRKQHGAPPGSISLLITGDEEGDAVNGTKKMLTWLADRGEKLDACLVGEPTNTSALGDMVKIGRRGSLTARLTVSGKQGHTAYPHLADNPVHRLVKILGRLVTTPLDEGSAHFPASTLQVSTFDVGNAATNVIPSRATAAINVRFNDLHESGGVEQWMRGIIDEIGGDYELDVRVSGESFLTAPGPLSDMIVRAVERVTGRKPTLGTTGGTSDARFIKDYCPVAEFGLVGQTMHKVDERVPTADIKQLTQIYQAIIEDYFGR